MTDQSTIQDYAMIDSFLNNSIQSYRRQAFGDYDSKTGYYNQQKIDNEDVVQQDLSEEADTFETDPVDEMGMSEIDYYDTMFGNGDYNQPQMNDEDDFYNFPNNDDNSDVNQVSTNNVKQGSFRFKNGVSGEGLQKDVSNLINELSSVAGEFVVTSGKRSDRENASLKGSAKKSFHLTGQAVDIRPNQNIDKFLSSQQGRKYLIDRGYEVIDERNVKGVSAHWHIEPVKRQAGGGFIPIARTKEEQFIGLNNDSIESLILPLSGTNTIRGLDSGNPVLVEDETGKSKVLRGPNHKARMKGRVFERKLIK